MDDFWIELCGHKPIELPPVHYDKDLTCTALAEELPFDSSADRQDIIEWLKQHYHEKGEWIIMAASDIPCASRKVTVEASSDTRYMSNRFGDVITCDKMLTIKGPHEWPNREINRQLEPYTPVNMAKYRLCSVCLPKNEKLELTVYYTTPEVLRKLQYDDTRIDFPEKMFQRIDIL